MMAFPLLCTQFLPGWALNVAFWVHRIEALLAIAHVVIIHFFIGHLRRLHFPMDMAMFDGNVDMAAMQQERPAWISRLKQEGRLNELVTAPSSTTIRIVSLVAGYAIIAAGVYLLVGIITNSMRINW